MSYNLFCLYPILSDPGSDPHVIYPIRILKFNKNLLLHRASLVKESQILMFKLAFSEFMDKKVGWRGTGTHNL